jgi:UDP:flavonoid glycosyltransferase YjiC (YdhE family)
MDQAVRAPEGTAGSSGAVVRFRARHTGGGGHLPPAGGDPNAPLVYVTFGTVAGGLAHMGEVFALALRSLSALPVRVLMTTGFAGRVVLDEVPENAHVERYWPQDQVMPLAAAMVGHGGFGTTLSALAAGVPQVVLPLFTTDQQLNAEAVATIGAGLSIPGGAESIPAAAAAVSWVLSDPDIRSAARRVADQIAALPEAAEVVDEVCRLDAGAAKGTITAPPPPVSNGEPT